MRIVLPTAAGGLITGAVLGVARVAGETAPLLFTSRSSRTSGITTDPSQALPNIPVTIFTLSESPSPTDHAQAWAAALVLICSGFWSRASSRESSTTGAGRRYAAETADKEPSWR